MVLGDPSVDPATNSGEITRLIRAGQRGCSEAFEKLFRRLYPDLRRLARSNINRRRRDSQIEGTALVSDACERLLVKDIYRAKNSRHLYFLIGRAMRDLIVENERARKAKKRGGNRRQERLRDVPDSANSTSNDTVHDLKAAIAELRRVDERSAQVAHLLLFDSMSVKEIAKSLQSTYSIVRREWEYARAWLIERLSSDHILR